MKFTIETKEPVPAFVPITFTVTCETAEEAREWWHRLNMSGSEIIKTIEGHGGDRVYEFDVDKWGNPHIQELFDKLDDALEAQGINP